MSKSRRRKSDSGWLLSIVAGLFLIALGLTLFFLVYGRIGGVHAPAGGLANLAILLSVAALIGIGVWLLVTGRNRYRRLRRLLRRRAAVRSKSDQVRRLDQGFYITAIGGGTGLSTILRGLKEISSHVSAIVTVTDDGGSSGRLLESGNGVPPGDIRNCLVALSPREGIMEDLFNYRFSQPEELRGHSLGNLMIAGLTDITGDTATAVRDIGRVLNIRGKVIPVTLDDVTLGAEMDDGETVCGETTIVADRRGIRRVFLTPPDSLVNADAIDAITGADVILLGPGSLYTSILPNLLVPGVIDALVHTRAPVWYVANIMTQRGETEGYNLSDHIDAIVGLSEEPFLTGVIVNTLKVTRTTAATYRKGGLSQVETELKAVKKYNLRVVGLPLAIEDGFVKHDADVLAQFIAAGRF
ncbi:MAG: gluconeogenesis factor YvcK family protein [Bacillota bacterium]|jgi:uncharacterized cofD-like protein